jgi:class 3 adenylate cyclase
VLVEFASVVDAVHCAAAIQRAMAERNRDLPVRERLELRIGVNLGDVIVEDDDLYGDGVNVAARLQAFAEPGGILVSGTSFDHAKNKVDVGFRFLGQQMVKNIADPVRVYRVLLGHESAGRVLGEIRTRRSHWPLSVSGAAIVLILGLLLGVWFGLGG